jgi:hypothetical protein
MTHGILTLLILLFKLLEIFSAHACHDSNAEHINPVVNPRHGFIFHFIETTPDNHYIGCEPLVRFSTPIKYREKS